jgi:hypothetical protein
MSYISHNSLLLLPMGLVLLCPYTLRMLDILPFDDILSYMLYTKHVHVFRFPSLSLIIDFSAQPTVIVLVPSPTRDASNFIVISNSSGYDVTLCYVNGQ